MLSVAHELGFRVNSFADKVSERDFFALSFIIRLRLLRPGPDVRVRCFAFALFQGHAVVVLKCCQSRQCFKCRLICISSVAINDSCSLLFNLRLKLAIPPNLVRIKQTNSSIIFFSIGLIVSHQPKANLFAEPFGTCTLISLTKLVN
jgi:hypothetical protein